MTLMRLIMIKYFNRLTALICIYITAKSSVRLRMAVAWGGHRDWASRGLFNAQRSLLSLFPVAL